MVGCWLVEVDPDASMFGPMTCVHQLAFLADSFDGGSNQVNIFFHAGSNNNNIIII